MAGGSRPAGSRLDQAAFQAHVELLQFFLARRGDIVERIQGLLNAQRQPIEYLRDGPLLARHLEDCFFALSDVTHSHSRLRGQLEDAHHASGFTPRDIPGLHNRLLDPAETIIRAFYLWQQTRWPGRNGRVRCAHTLFNLYVVRCLALLSMRLWDAEPSGSSGRLSQVQSVLDQLWWTRTPDQPVLVRDARWLIPMAQSPATDDLAAYFGVAAHVAEIPSDEDRLEIHKTGIRLTGGHLRSQFRYHSTKKGASEQSVVLASRTSNALDFALLIQDLVPVLEAYERAWRSGDDKGRLDLAGVICQGLSVDPELFVNRVEVLGPYSMIEHLFITTDSDGRAAYTPMGQRQVRLFQEYAVLIGRLSKPLSDDSQHFRPVAGRYSPYGVLYGFTSDLVGHMVLKALQPDVVTRFSLEDVFVDGDADALAWVSGWRKLPHLSREVQQQFEYPQQFAEDSFSRVQEALRRRASDSDADAVAQTGRLYLVPEGDSRDDSKAQAIPELPVQYIKSSDEPSLLADRREGRCVLSYKTPGGWVAISKDLLTEVLGAGRDAKIVGLPHGAAGVLKLMCPGLVEEWD
jgi:hypothetical protein